VATHWYSKLSGDTDYLADQLYEQVWAFVRLEDDLHALESLELFLLYFPDHLNAGRLRLARGHLQMRRGKWEKATDEYQPVVDDFTPLRGAPHDSLPL